MDVTVRLPLDSDGFIRRECPHCEKQFKWHHGLANEEAEGQFDPVAYYCPLCGEPGAPDAWWTTEQLEYIHGFAAPAILRSVRDEMVSAFRGNQFIKVESTGDTGSPDVPESLTEPDDMVIVASPCHGFEPIKIPDPSAGPFHCLLCGEAFAV